VDAWDSIEKNALWTLEHATDLSPRDTVEGMAPSLRLWEYCSEGTYTAWTILSLAGSDNSGRPKVREVVWKRRQDEKHQASANRKHKLRTKPHSTIQVRDAEISSKDLSPYLEAAARLFVPDIPDQNSVPQGDSFGIEGYRSLAYLRMEWRGPGPAEWAETIRWVARLRDLLTASLKEREEVEG
jgi:hypothetical protein